MSERAWATRFAALVLAATALFVGGVIMEANAVHSETAAEAEGAASEQVFGLGAESRPLVVLAVAVALGLAGLALRRPSRWVFVVGAAFCLLSAALDLRESVHQSSEGRGVLVAVAGLVAVLHLAGAAAAAVAVRQGRSRDTRAVQGA